MTKLKHSTILLMLVVLLFALLACEEEESYSPNHHPEILSVGQLGNGIQVLGSDTLVCIATDIDGDSLEYTWSAPAGSLSGSGDTVIWHAPYQGALYPFSCIVTDGKDGIAEVEFSIQVYDFFMGNWTVLNKNNSALPSNLIEEIEISENNVVWIFAEGGGATRYAGSSWSNWDIYLGDGVLIDVDSRGNLWAVLGWVKMVDGVTIAEIPIDRRAIDVSVDREDTVWVSSRTPFDASGNWSGLSKFDGSAWTHFDSSNSGLTGKRIKAFGFDNYNDLWCSVDSSLIKFDGVSWTEHSAPFGSYRIAFDSKNQIWIANSQNLAFYDGLSWVQIPLPHERWWWGPLAIDAADNVWCSFYDTGFGVFNGEDWLIYTPENSTLPSNYVRAIAISPFGDKWIGAWGYEGYGSGDGGIVVTDASINPR